MSRPEARPSRSAWRCFARRSWRVEHQNRPPLGVSSSRPGTLRLSSRTSSGPRLGQALGQRQEALLFVLGHGPVGQPAELVHVLRSPERPGAEGVGVGHGDLVLEDACRRPSVEHGAAPEGLSGQVARRSRPGPPPCDTCARARSVSGLWPARGVGRLVVPGAVLQGDGEDVGERVVEGLSGRLRVELLRVARAGPDDVVGVVARVDLDRAHLAQVLRPVLRIRLARSMNAWAWYSAECSLV